MNFIVGMLLSLWTAGWIVAMVRAGLKVRAVGPAEYKR
jgi:hypothetical protein